MGREHRVDHHYGPTAEPIHHQRNPGISRCSDWDSTAEVLNQIDAFQELLYGW